MDREHYASYVREEANHEIARLQVILRDPRSTQEERDVARSMLNFYQDARLEEDESFLQSAQPARIVARRMPAASEIVRPSALEGRPRKGKKAA
jgi:hypothetical protein